MKHLIFITSIITLLVWNLSCTKETIETQTKEDCIEKTVIIEWNEGAKFGALDVFFMKSNSKDNALTGEARKHEIFNQAKINYQKFTPLDQAGFFYNNVFHWPYFMEVFFDNDSIGVHKVGVGFVDGTEFTHYPNIDDNLLSNNHPAYVVSYTATPKTIKYTNGKRNQQINLKAVELSFDGVPIEIQVNTPLTRNSNQPDYGHQH